MFDLDLRHHRSDEQRITDLMTALQPLATLSLDRCPWCDDESWYGANHMEHCPVAVARRALLGIGEF